MNLGEEILAAVKAGGLESFRPTCEKNQKLKQDSKATKNNVLENGLNALYDALGNEQLTTPQLAEKLGWNPELVRSRAKILMGRKKIKRSTGKMPFVFYRV
jgi:hypothetical protein